MCRLSPGKMKVSLLTQPALRCRPVPSGAAAPHTRPPAATPPANLPYHQPTSQSSNRPTSLTAATNKPFLVLDATYKISHFAVQNLCRGHCHFSGQFRCSVAEKCWSVDCRCCSLALPVLLKLLKPQPQPSSGTSSQLGVTHRAIIRDTEHSARYARYVQKLQR